jgi:hypothetical protein
LFCQVTASPNLTYASDFVFAFYDADEIGPRMLARIAKHTGLTPADL